MSGKIGRLLSRVKEGWLVLCITLLYLLVLEVALSLAYGVADRIRAASPVSPDGRARADVYAGVPWADEYFKELEECSVTRWTSYVYWRRQPYRGRHINIDEHGIRRTWTSRDNSPGAGNPLRIFTFGGSAMWGVGARDDFTIPSFLARKLGENGVRCRVTNFGESGYVSTQEVIALLQQVRDGNIPDVVIFYDGVNDIYSAYQQAAAGLPQNESHRAREFNVSQPKGYRPLRTLCARRVAGELAMVRFARNLLRRGGIEIGPGATATHDTAALNSAAEKEILLRRILAVYENNMKIVSILGETHGFKPLFYWQPTVFDRTHPTVYEQGVQQEMRDVRPFCRRTCELIRLGECVADLNGAFCDVSGIFREAQNPVFLDWCHVSEWGNEQIAGRMAADTMRLPGMGGVADGPASERP